MRIKFRVFNDISCKYNGLGGTCSAYGGEKRRIQGFWLGEPEGKKTTWVILMF